MSRFPIPTVIFLFVAATLMAGGRLANAATLYVPSQYANIMAAVTAATTGDTIIVANGTYTGVNNRNIEFGGKDLIVKSSGGAINCIIDCQQLGRAFKLSGGETAASRVEGFTIQNGKVTNEYGGGILVGSNSNATVSNCVLVNNTVVADNTYNSSGGAMCRGNAIGCLFKNNTTNRDGGGTYNTSATNCSFVGNTASRNGGGMIGGTATNCTFTANASLSNSSGLLFGGGGTYAANATNCTYTGNTATTSGGGMYDGTATNCTFVGNTGRVGGGVFSASVTRCIFRNNIATNEGGGGMYAGQVSASLFLGNRATNGNGGGFFGSSNGNATNCVFSGNTAKVNGGGVSDATLLHCTVANNIAEGSFGGGVYNSTTTNTITNSIVWGNTSATSSPQIKNDGGTLTVTNSDVQGDFVGTGNINADPLFVDAANGDLHLKASSPCIDAGTTSGVSLPAKDCNGGTRVLGNAPDMGAYESGNYNPAAPIVGVRDFNGDTIPDLVTDTEGKPTFGYLQLTADGAQITSVGMTSQAPSGGWQVVGAGRFAGGNGTPDLLLTNPTDQRIHFWHINGTTRTGGEFAYYGNQPNTHMMLPSGFAVLGTTDFDEDGREDIAWFDPVLRRLGVWSMHGASFYSGAYLSHTLPQGWNIVGMGRLDPYVFPELLLLGPNRELHVWFMTYGWNWYSGSYVLNPSDNSIVTLPEGWKVVGMADINRDGLEDVLVQNRAENKIEYWTINPYTLYLTGRFPITLR